MKSTEHILPYEWKWDSKWDSLVVIRKITFSCGCSVSTVYYMFTNYCSYSKLNLTFRPLYLEYMLHIFFKRILGCKIYTTCKLAFLIDKGKPNIFIYNVRFIFSSFFVMINCRPCLNLFAWSDGSPSSSAPKTSSCIVFFSLLCNLWFSTRVLKALWFLMLSSVAFIPCKSGLYLLTSSWPPLNWIILTSFF